MDLDIVFLGTSASAPTAQRAPAALLVRRGGDKLLFDCAEGTQRQLMRSTLGLPDLEEIFLTHFHADHYLGLPGMLKTFSLRQRELPLTIYGPAGLRDLYKSLGRIVGKLSYPVELEEVRPGEALERDDYRILVFPVHHGVSAVGYAVAEDERPGEFDAAAADVLGIPFGPERGALQRGESVTLDDGKVLTPDAVLGPPRPGRRIVIPGDTAPVETVRVLSEGADVLIHEATFLEDERDRAADTLHSTALQAAELARDAGVRLLALTHVSPRYFGAELAREAREVFPATVVPKDFDVIEVPFAERGEPELIRRGARPEKVSDTPTRVDAAP
jgi:ribonuclease Z